MLLPVSPAVAGAIARGKRLREEDLEQKRLRELERQEREFSLQKAKELYPFEKELMQLDVALRRNQKIQSDIYTQNYENMLKAQLDNLRANTEFLSKQAQYYDKLTEKMGYDIRLIRENLRDIRERRKVEQELQPVIEGIIDQVDEFLEVHDKYKNLNRQRAIKMMTSPLAKPEEFLEIDKQIQAATKDMAEIRRIVRFLASKALPQIKDPSLRELVVGLVKKIDISDEMQETMFTMIKTVRDNALVSVIKGLKGIDNLDVDKAFEIFSSMSLQDQEHVLKLVRYKMAEIIFSKEMFPFMSLFVAYNADRDPTGSRVLDFFGTAYKFHDREKDRELTRWIWGQRMQMFWATLKFKYDELAERREYHHILAALNREKVKQGWEALRLRHGQILANFYSKVLALRYGLYRMDLKVAADMMKAAWRELVQAVGNANVVLPPGALQELGKFLISSAMGVAPSSIVFDEHGNLVVTPRFLSEAYEISLNGIDEIDTMLPGGGMFSPGGFFGGSPGEPWQGPMPNTPGPQYRPPTTGQRTRMGMGAGPGGQRPNQPLYIEYDPFTDTVRFVNAPGANQPPSWRPPVGGPGGPGGPGLPVGPELPGGPGFPFGYPIVNPNMLFYGKERADMLRELIHLDPNIVRSRVFGNVTIGLATRGNLSDSEWNTLARIFNQYVKSVISKRTRDPGYIGSLKTRTGRAIESAPLEAGVPHWVTVAQAIAYQDFVNTLHEAIKKHVKDEKLQKRLLEVADIDFSYSEPPQLPSAGKQEGGGKKPGGIYTEHDTGEMPGKRQEDLIKEAPMTSTPGSLSEENLRKRQPFINNFINLARKTAPYYVENLNNPNVVLTQLIIHPRLFVDLKNPAKSGQSLAGALGKALSQRLYPPPGWRWKAYGYGGPPSTIIRFNNVGFIYDFLNILRQNNWRVVGDFILAVRNLRDPNQFSYYVVVGWGPLDRSGALIKVADEKTLKKLPQLMKNAKDLKLKTVTFYIRKLSDQEVDKLFSEPIAPYLNALRNFQPMSGGMQK